jgi:hypothetical protein
MQTVTLLDERVNGKPPKMPSSHRTQVINPQHILHRPGENPTQPKEDPGLNANEYDAENSRF